MTRPPCIDGISDVPFELRDLRDLSAMVAQELTYQQPATKEAPSEQHKQLSQGQCRNQVCFLACTCVYWQGGCAWTKPSEGPAAPGCGAQPDTLLTCKPCMQSLLSLIFAVQALSAQPASPHMGTCRHGWPRSASRRQCSCPQLPPFTLATRYHDDHRPADASGWHNDDKAAYIKQCIAVSAGHPASILTMLPHASAAR